MSSTLTRVAAASVASIATCDCGLANVVLSCSGTMDGPGVSTQQQASVLSVTLDPTKGTVVVGDAGPIPALSDAADRTLTFGNATSPIFGILNTVTGSIFISHFAPVATYRGVCKKLDR